MKKRVLFILLIGISLLTIISCGKKEESFKILFEGTNITPGLKFDINNFRSTYDSFEEPNCALGGKGMKYTFDDLEISVSDKNIIYSVYFLNPNYTTEEGIALGDSKEDVIKTYGENASKGDNALLYTKGNVELSFIFSENDTVDSIEYVLVVE